MLYQFAPTQANNYFVRAWNAAVNAARTEMNGFNLANPDEAQAQRIINDMITLVTNMINAPLQHIDDVNMGLMGTWGRMARLAEWQPEQPPAITQARILYLLTYCRAAVQRPITEEERQANAQNIFRTGVHNNISLPLGYLSQALEGMIARLTELQADMQQRQAR